MFKYKNNDININISGTINRYQSLSATGKTYLPEILKKYSDFPALQVYSTKSEYDIYISRDFKIGLDKRIIYFFDRFDLFGNDAIVESFKSINDVTILIDCKDPLKLWSDDLYVNDIVIRRLGIWRFEIVDDNFD